MRSAGGSCRPHALNGFYLADARNALAALRRALLFGFQSRLKAPRLFVRLSGRELMKRVEATDGDADTLIHSDRLRQNAEDDRDKMEQERDAALRREATALAERDIMRRIAAIAIMISILVISVGGVLLWFDFKKQSGPTPPPPRCEQCLPRPPPPGPASSPQPSPTQSPAPRPRTPSRVHMQRCGAPDCCWEYPSCLIHNRPAYDGGECWRDRSTQGPCFD